MSIINSNTSFLLLVNWDGIEDVSKIKDSFKTCFNEKQYFEILLLTSVKRPKENFNLPSRAQVISSTDFSLFRKLKSKKILPSENTFFDIVMILEEIPEKYNQIISLLEGKHVISFGYELNCVDINLVYSNPLLIEKVKFAKDILTKISD